MKNINQFISRSARAAACGAAVVLALTLGGRAEAYLIADESFAYAPGTLAGDNGGTGWGSAWQVWFGSAAVNNQQATISGNTWSYRPLAAPVTLSAGDQIWFSFIGKETSPVTSYAGLSAFSGWNERGFIGDTMWADPSSPAQLADSFAVATGTFTGPSMQFDTIRLGSGDGAMSFDNVRVGTTAADVYSSASVEAVPEPGVGMLLGLGMVGIVVMRRYRAQAATA